VGLNAGEESTKWKPVDAAERYTILDLLRGIALFGVLLVNLLYFFRLPLFAHVQNFHSHAGWVNHAVDLLVAEFVEFKAFDLFSLTFGIGIAVQAERAGRRGVGVELFLMRRFLVLLGVGICHVLLVANVDILCLYALCGLLVIPLLRLPARVLAVAGLAAIYLPSVFSGWPSLPPESVWRVYVANAMRIYAHGSFAAILEFRRLETQTMIVPLLAGVAQKTFGLMVLGVAVWRAGVIREPWRYRSALWTVCAVGAMIGLVNTAADVLAESFKMQLRLPRVLNALGSHLPLALAYAAGLLAWERSERAVAFTSPIAAAGRMALTNYLVQSLVFALVFYGYGFQLFGRLDPQTAAAFGTVFYAVQLWFSVRWLKRYRFGPFEWLWRSLTYGRLQPMRCAAASGPKSATDPMPMQKL
jgi:uncharacterized protein